MPVPLVILTIIGWSEISGRIMGTKATLIVRIVLI
jgi:hypothetical protein